MSSPSSRTPDVPRDRFDTEPDDTGPIPLVGDVPVPSGAGRRPRDDADEAGKLPITEQPIMPPGASPSPGRAGRNLGAAIGVGVGLAAVIVASLLVWRPAFLGVLGVAILIAVVELSRALHAGGFRRGNHRTLTKIISPVDTRPLPGIHQGTSSRAVEP